MSMPAANSERLRTKQSKYQRSNSLFLNVDHRVHSKRHIPLRMRARDSTMAAILTRALILVQIVDLVGVGLSHLVLLVSLSEDHVGVCRNDGFGDAPVHGEGVGAVVHDALVVVSFAHVLPVGVLVELGLHAWQWKECAALMNNLF